MVSCLPSVHCWINPSWNYPKEVSTLRKGGTEEKKLKWEKRRIFPGYLVYHQAWIPCWWGSAPAELNSLGKDQDKGSKESRGGFFFTSGVLSFLWKNTILFGWNGRSRGKSRLFVYFLVRTEAVAVGTSGGQRGKPARKTKQTDEKVLRVEKIAVESNSPVNLWTEGLNINFRTE